jgi:predicted DNA repair protein MutK
VADAPLATQVVVLVAIAIVMTAGVYGLVAGIVKLDDLGLYLRARGGAGAGPRIARALGAGILRAAPWLMRFLSVAGTAAMFLVGGGILAHGVPFLRHWVEGLTDAVGDWPGVGDAASALAPLLANALVGVVAGAVLVAAIAVAQRAWKRREKAPA